MNFWVIYWSFVLIAGAIFLRDLTVDVWTLIQQLYPDTRPAKVRHSAFKPWSIQKRRAMEILYDCFDPDTGAPDTTRRADIDKYYPVAYNKPFVWTDTKPWEEH